MNLIQSIYESPIGPIELKATERGLSSLYFTNHRHDRHLPAKSGSSPVIEQAKQELSEYFAKSRKEFTVPLDPVGTEFQLRVWEQLKQIPFGLTISYIELARRIGNEKASRAVGAANGKNPISIIIPCHRVIAADGTLHGYGGGLPIKQALLELENAVFTKQESLFSE
ncbi:MAG: methylated-DNA--[protein]-cysteine S-methyltransferase [Fimbriimonadaceae bacterium]|nr:MAG: methylated-DNA--[protein]-cysteine S-methyltransferase [Fimbriimonadaceae bacterium]